MVTDFNIFRGSGNPFGGGADPTHALIPNAAAVSSQAGAERSPVVAGNVARVSEFINGVRSGGINGVVYVPGEGAEVISIACDDGIALSVRRVGEMPVEVARLSVNGSEVVFKGAYTREIRSFFQLKEWQPPSTFIISRETSRLPVDDYMIDELKKYFGQKFGPEKAYTHKTKFVFSGQNMQEIAEAEEVWLTRTHRFFGEGMGAHSEFAKRWEPDGPFGDMLGERSVDPVVATKLESQLPPVIEKSLPTVPKHRDGFSMKTIGVSPPGSTAGATSHRLLYFDNEVVALEMPSYAYSEGVGTIVISHYHADHMNPRALLRQLQINAARGIQTTLLTGPDCQAGILEQLAMTDGWLSSSNIGASEWLGRRYSFDLSNSRELGNHLIKMVDSPYGIHGAPNASFEVTKFGEPVYFYSGDGDFNPESLLKRQGEVQARLKEVEPKFRELYYKQLSDQKSTPEFKALFDEYVTLQEQDVRIQKTLERIQNTKHVDVDVGTSGFDTHGNKATADKMQRMRVESYDPFDVRPTHNNGYNETKMVDGKPVATNKTSVPEINEGRIDIFDPFGERTTRLPRLNDELKQLGAEFASKTEKAKVKLWLGDAEEIVLKDCASTRGAIKRLMEKFSVTASNGEEFFALKDLHVQGTPAYEWLDKIGLTPKANPAPKAAASVPAGPKKLLGISTEMPEWLIEHNQMTKGPAEFENLKSFIEGSPKISKALATAAIYGKGALKVAGKVAPPALLTYELFTRGAQLAAGDKKAWSQFAGDMASLGVYFIPQAGQVLGLTELAFTLPYVAAGLQYNTLRHALGRGKFSLGNVWKGSTTAVFPVTRTVNWAVTNGLYKLLGVNDHSEW